MSTLPLLPTRITQQSTPPTSLLGIPLEIRNLIYDFLIHDPKTSPKHLYRFLDHTCHEITCEAEALNFRPLFATINTNPHITIEDWRPEALDDILSKYTAIELNLVRRLSVDPTGWNRSSYSPSPSERTFDNEEGLMFWEVHDEGAAWVLVLLDMFPGVDYLTLYCDGHGFHWDFDGLVGGFGRGVNGWGVVSDDEGDDGAEMELVCEHIWEEGIEADFTKRRREVTITIR